MGTEDFFQEDHDEVLKEEFPERNCMVCSLTTVSVQLEICRVCFREFCGDCAFRGPWGRFCSAACNEDFYYGDEDEKEAIEESD